ncbi:glycosyltransferase family 4 protein [Acetivibrio saccincola]|uniref:N, N'-diacetylbacillosaminyl-diphospho-undecaprenol alpha-1,3-N-acetylgalactosaminyltransferase n=1 Tax=Acetivibrio saccincola TaxID=1677857 RepID=A0A2K9E4E0_9FIRM|nr:glycosyltransferase family 4 protein [Acetivibrio saccincola]AUG58597.1 N,N'-diacetylbacillosaminyl-diphospho-undecaprenol alpha-1,3-N-acetylgalactosaminyltransferase [Acetivibrio saccincola]
MKKILILANHFITIYAFRKELVEELIKDGNEVFLALPESKDNTFFSEMGCKLINTPLDRRGTNPISDMKLLLQYIRIIKKSKPDIILTYTIKPNIYGGIASRICKSKVIHTVTGLGSVYIQDMWQKEIVVLLNRLAFKKASKIYFLNEDNEKFYKKLKIISSNNDTAIVPGSGVNLEKFKYMELLPTSKITFTFIGRILKDKGIEEFLFAAKILINKYNNVKFQVVGFVDEKKYIELLDRYQKKGIIEYLGKRDDIPKIMAESTCIVLPSYGEGRGTVLQEGAAIGRALITCDTYGCKENVEEGYNGFLCKVADPESLTCAMEKFIKLSHEEKVLMGMRSRKKAEIEFDRNIIVNEYMQGIKKILKVGVTNESI